MSIDPGPGYRLLEKGEVIEKGDQILFDGVWEVTVLTGQVVANATFRRKVDDDYGPVDLTNEKPDTFTIPLVEDLKQQLKQARIENEELKIKLAESYKHTPTGYVHRRLHEELLSCYKKQLDEAVSEGLGASEENHHLIEEVTKLKGLLKALDGVVTKSPHPIRIDADLFHKIQKAIK